MNFVDATVAVKGDVAHLQALGQEIALPADKSQKLIDGGYDGKVVTLGIRPENIKEDAEGVFEADVKVYELLGAEVLLYVDIAEEPLTARVSSRTATRVGDKIKVSFDVERIHVFDKETEQVITN
jgi:multiple sugar transport system ATP-binding protein